MSLQETLTEDAPLVLDATCSTKVKTRWPKFASLRMDVRREVEPDIVASATCLPFRDRVFVKIYCDPPHVIDSRGIGAFARSTTSMWYASVNRKRGRLQGELFRHHMRRFGVWRSREEWLDFVKRSGEEFARCLKSSGTLEYKLSEVKGNKKVCVTDLELMREFVMVGKDQTQSNSGNPTYWLTMKKTERER